MSVASAVTVLLKQDESADILSITAKDCGVQLNIRRVTASRNHTHVRVLVRGDFLRIFAFFDHLTSRHIRWECTVSS